VTWRGTVGRWRTGRAVMTDGQRAEATAFAAAARLSLFYVAAFAVLGVYMPYWSLWLRGRGCSDRAIAWVLCGQIVARTVAGPLWAQHSDHSGQPRRVLRLLAWASLLAFLPFTLADSLPALVGCSVVFGAFFPPIHAIADNLTVAVASQHRFAYGRVRVFGSVAFLVVTVLMGVLLDRWHGAGTTDGGSGPIFGIVLGLLCATAFASAVLPPQQRERRGHGNAAIAALLSNGRFVLFLCAVGLLQGSHAAYYGYATLHWTQHGIDPGVAGVLWAEGVLAEIVLFASIGTRTRAWSSRTLLLLGAAGGMLRWAVIGCTTSLPLLAGVQWLHALSFGCVHLGAVQFITKVVPGRYGATAQGLTAAATAGVFTALGTLLSGWLHEAHGGAAFLAMAGMACCGGCAALMLGRDPEAAA